MELIINHLNTIDDVCGLIEEEKEYATKLVECVKEIEQVLAQLINLELECEKEGISFMDIDRMNMILNDIMDGMGREDNVFLLDALRYGYREELSEIDRRLTSLL